MIDQSENGKARGIPIMRRNDFVWKGIVALLGVIIMSTVAPNLQSRNTSETNSDQLGGIRLSNPVFASTDTEPENSFGHRCFEVENAYGDEYTSSGWFSIGAGVPDPEDLGIDEEMTVNVSMTSGTAIVGVDFEPWIGTVTINRGSGIFFMQVRFDTVYDDAEYEGMETFYVTLSNPTGLSICPGSEAFEALLYDDDRPTPTPTPTPTPIPPPTPPNPDTIDIKVRAFIPCGAVTSPTGDLFGGDNRSFSYSGGQSRFEEHLIVAMDLTFANPIIERPSSRYWESTRLYTSLNDAGQQNGTGNQEWCRQLISSPSVPEIRPASIGSFDRPAYGGKLQSGEGIAIEFFMEAGNAFLGGTPPKLDANIVVFLRQNKGNEPEYRIYGKHDGFPAYEIYLNQQLVYCHDPIRSGDSPLSLFGGLGFGGVTADTRAWKEIQAIDCSPIKGIRTNSPIGEKGSKFTVTGNGFNSSNMLSANSIATITSTVNVYINNVLLGEVNLDENGKFQVVLDTANASYGIYEVVASNNITTTTFSTEFQLQADSFLIQELDGVATSFSIPPDIAYSPFSIFLPNIQR
jgi:hypothetical protein